MLRKRKRPTMEQYCEELNKLLDRVEVSKMPLSWKCISEASDKTIQNYNERII